MEETGIVFSEEEVLIVSEETGIVFTEEEVLSVFFFFI